MSCNVSSSCHPHINLLRILLAVDCLSILGYYPMYPSQRILPMLTTKFLVAKITAATNRKHIGGFTGKKLCFHSTSLCRARHARLSGIPNRSKTDGQPSELVKFTRWLSNFMQLYRAPYRLTMYWGHQLVLVAVNHIDP